MEPFTFPQVKLMDDLDRYLSLVPPEKQEAARARVAELRANGTSLGEINRNFKDLIRRKREANNAPGTRGHELAQDPEAVKVPPGFEPPTPTKALGDKGKLAMLGLTSAPNLPRDALNLGATINRYATPLGWIRGDKYLDEVDDMHRRIEQALPLYKDMNDARDFARDEYMETAANKKAAGWAAIGSETLLDLSNYNPLGALKAVGSVAVKVGGLAMLRSSLKSAAKGAMRHTPYDLAERALIRTAIEGEDISRLVAAADSLATRGKNLQSIELPGRVLDEAVEFPGGVLQHSIELPDGGGVLQRNLGTPGELKPKGSAQPGGVMVRETDELGKLLEDRAYSLLNKAEEIKKARDIHGTVLDEAKFTNAEIEAANALQDAESVAEVLHFAPEEVRPIEEVVKEIIDRADLNAGKGAKRGRMPKFFDFLEKHAGSRGGQPDDVFLARIGAKQRPILAVYDMRVLGSAVKDLVENRFKDPTLYDDFARYTMGQGNNLPKELKVLGDQMRESLDSVSKEILTNPNLDPKLRKAIEDNYGSYFHRDFDVIENPFHKQDVDPKAVEAFKANLREHYNITEAQVEGITGAALSAKHNPIITVDDNLVSRAGRTVFKKRKNLDPVYLALLGERTDPLHKATRTAYYLNLAAAEMEFNAKLGPRLAEHGMAMKVGKQGKSYVPTGPFTVPLAQTPGFYVTEDIAKILEDQTKLSKMSLSMALNGMTKGHQTVLSPSTHIKNFLSNGWVALALGHPPNPFHGRSFSGAKGIMEHIDIPNDKEMVEWVRDLLKEGALGTNIDIGDMLEFKNSIDYYTRKGLGWTGKGKEIAEGYGKVLDFGSKWYQGGDNYWKLYIYGRELKRYNKAYIVAGMPAEASAKLAKERAIRVVRDATQNYNFLPKIGRQLRQNVVVGPFASFPIESARNFGNLARITAEDLGDPVTRAIGLKRLAGLGATFMAEDVMSRFISAATKVPRSLTLHSNAFMPDYHQNKTIAGMDWDGEKLTYRVLSEGNYYNYVTNLLRGAQQSEQDGTEYMLKLLTATTDNILAPSLIAGPVLEGLQEPGTLTQKFAEGGKQFVENLTPGAIKQPLEIARAGDVPGVRRILGPEPISRGDRTAIEQATGYVHAMPEYEVDIPHRFRSLIGEQMRKFNGLKTLAKKYTSLPDQLQSQRKVQKAWDEVNQQTTFLVGELRKMEVPDDMIYQWLQDAKFNKNEAVYFLQDQVPPLRPPEYSSL